MTVPASADRGLHDRPIVIQEIGLLITKVDLHRILGASCPRQKRRKRRDRRECRERKTQTKPEDLHTCQLLSVRRTKRKKITLFFEHCHRLFADGKPSRDELLLIRNGPEVIPSDCYGTKESSGSAGAHPYRIYLTHA